QWPACSPYNEHQHCDQWQSSYQEQPDGTIAHAPSLQLPHRNENEEHQQSYDWRRVMRRVECLDQQAQGADSQEEKQEPRSGFDICPAKSARRRNKKRVLGFTSAQLKARGTEKASSKIGRLSNCPR